MPAAMSVTVSTLSGYGKVRRHEVSVPLVTALLEPPTRYALSAEPALRAKRRPHLKALVRLALKCDTAALLLQPHESRQARRSAPRDGAASPRARRRGLGWTSAFRDLKSA